MIPFKHDTDRVMDWEGRDLDLSRILFLKRLMSRLNVPQNDLEDVVQEALYRFYRLNYHQRALESSMDRALLARVGFSSWLDLVRRRNTSLRHLEAFSRNIRVKTGEDELSCKSAVAELYRRAAISPADQQFLAERFNEGTTLETLADRHGRHVNSIRKRLDRLMARLRRAAALEDALSRRSLGT